MSYMCLGLAGNGKYDRTVWLIEADWHIYGSHNGLSPGRRQATIWTNAGIWLKGSLETYLNKTVSEIHTFSFKKMHLKMSSEKS